jgi:hypothetical protein
MTNQSEFLSIKQASILTGKSELTIRRLIKSKKVDFKLTNQWYVIDKISLSEVYTLVNDEIEKPINQVSSHFDDDWIYGVLAFMKGDYCDK